MTFPRVSFVVDDLSVELSFTLEDEDASCWKRPFTLSIAPQTQKPGESWETDLDLTREQAAFLRDSLTLMLRIPDRLERQGEAEDKARAQEAPHSGS
jgi:hypothetical protein